MPQHLLEKYLLPTMQLRKTLDREGKDINEILTNFEEQQLKRDYKSFERTRQQNVLVTRLNYEQQLHIHDLNFESFNVANQRQELVDKALRLRRPNESVAS